MSSISYISCFPKIFNFGVYHEADPSHSEAATILKRILSGTYDVSTNYKHLLLSSICMVWTTLSPSASTLETREEGSAGSLTCSWWGQVSTFSPNPGSKPGQPGQNCLGMRLITCLLYHCDRVSRI